MLRRLHVDDLFIGEIELSQSEAHHARDVLRLTEGTQVELFDNAGRCATGSIAKLNSNCVVVQINDIKPARAGTSITIASAIPKGERADWMIEKLSELGVSKFIPLITERSVVQASGKNKLDRWRRIALESAKQSRRAGVMQIDEPTTLDVALASLENIFALSTTPDAKPIAPLAFDSPIALLIGPEGGWSDTELAMFESRSIPSIKLTATVLRVETAAIVAAGILLTIRARE